MRWTSLPFSAIETEAESDGDVDVKVVVGAENAFICTWKVILVPFRRTCESLPSPPSGVLALSSGGEGVSGCERIVTRGTNAFHEGQVDVSTSAAQTWDEGAAMMLELPMWSFALEAGMLGVDLEALVGSVRSGMFGDLFIYSGE